MFNHNPLYVGARVVKAVGADCERDTASYSSPGEVYPASTGRKK